MGNDPRRNDENRRMELEKEIARSIGSLEKILRQFRNGLKKRRELRDYLQDTLSKVSIRRQEAIDSLKINAQKMERLKSALEKAASELKKLTREEAVLKGKYNELLAGRLPPEENAQDDFDQIFGNTALNAEKRKEIFIGKINSAFEKLDAKIIVVKRKKDGIQEAVEKSETAIKSLERKKGVLQQKLAIYKNEALDCEQELSLSEEEEKILMAEYADFSMRLNTAVSFSPEIMGILERKLPPVIKPQSLEKQSDSQETEVDETPVAAE